MELYDFLSLMFMVTICVVALKAKYESPATSYQLKAGDSLQLKLGLTVYRQHPFYAYYTT